MKAVPEFDEWYRRQHPRLVASILLVTGSLDEAQEAADEALARALLHWRRVAPMESPEGWVYRVALNVARRRARRRSMERSLLHRARPVITDVPAPAGEAWAAVKDLPPRQREIVVLRHVADLTEAQIARALGISRSTVSSTLGDAHLALSRTLADSPRHAVPPPHARPAGGAS